MARCVPERRRCPFCERRAFGDKPTADSSKPPHQLKLPPQASKVSLSPWGCIETAPGPAFRGARYSIDFVIEVATDKLCDCNPLERQVRKMGRERLDVDSQTLWGAILEKRLLQIAHSAHPCGAQPCFHERGKRARGTTQDAGSTGPEPEVEWMPHEIAQDVLSGINDYHPNTVGEYKSLS